MRGGQSLWRFTSGDLLDQQGRASRVVVRHRHGIRVHCPFLDAAVGQSGGHSQVARVAVRVTPQVTKERIEVARLGNGQLVMHRRRTQGAGIEPQVFGMAVRNEAVVADDPEFRERANVLGQRVGPAGTSVQLVNLLDRDHETKLSLDVRSEGRLTIPYHRVGGGY
jgi:hypothetical protein